MRGLVRKALWPAAPSPGAACSGRKRSRQCPLLVNIGCFLRGAGGRWTELNLAEEQAKLLRFEDVWTACEKRGKPEDPRTLAVRVAEFLQQAGLPSRKPTQRIDAWTAKPLKLHLKKKQHFWQQAWSGARGTRPWVATRPTLRKVWPHLRR